MTLKTIKSISRLLAQNRARNDASNRLEFLQSQAEKRRRLEEQDISDTSDPIPSCARADAKTQNRDLQMKYDIAKNEDGPLRKTMKCDREAVVMEPRKTIVDKSSAEVTTDRHPGIDERLRNIETHVAVRYGNVFRPTCWDLFTYA